MSHIYVILILFECLVWSDLNPCDSAPCENAGKCNRVSSEKYKCECKSGFVGEACELKEGNPHDMLFSLFCSLCKSFIDIKIVNCSYTYIKPYYCFFGCGYSSYLNTQCHN